MCWIYNILWTITKFFLLLQPQILISRKFSNNIYEIIDPPYSASIKQWFLYSLVFLEQATHWLNIPPHPLFSHSYYVWSLAYLSFIVIISSIDTWHFYIGGSIVLVAPGGRGWGGARVYEILKENLKLHYLCVKSTHPAIRRRGDVVTTSQVTLSWAQSGRFSRLI